ncbi:hypothetical protein FRX31_011038, partial [Thalictrum thalictroides]
SDSDADESFIPLAFHHGGAFRYAPHLVYRGGETRIFHVDVDKLSYFETKGLASENLGYNNICKIHWCTPGDGHLTTHLSPKSKVVVTPKRKVAASPKRKVAASPKPDDEFSESEASDVNNLDHMDSDEDDPELVDVIIKHIEDTNAEMMKKIDLEKFLAAARDEACIK